MPYITADKYILEQSQSKTIESEDSLIQLNLNLRLNTNPLRTDLIDKLTKTDIKSTIKD